MEDNLDPLKSKDKNDNSLKSFPNTNNNKNISSSSEEKSSEVKLNPETQKLKDNVFAFRDDMDEQTYSK